MRKHHANDRTAISKRHVVHVTVLAYECRCISLCECGNNARHYLIFTDPLPPGLTSVYPFARFLQRPLTICRWHFFCLLFSSVLWFHLRLCLSVAFTDTLSISERWLSFLAWSVDSRCSGHNAVVVSSSSYLACTIATDRNWKVCVHKEERCALCEGGFRWPLDALPYLAVITTWVQCLSFAAPSFLFLYLAFSGSVCFVSDLVSDRCGQEQELSTLRWKCTCLRFNFKLTSMHWLSNRYSAFCLVYHASMTALAAGRVRLRAADRKTMLVTAYCCIYSFIYRPVLSTCRHRRLLKRCKRKKPADRRTNVFRG